MEKDWNSHWNSEVTVQDLMSGDGNKVSAKAVFIENMKGEQQEVGIVSPDYLLVPNTKVVELIMALTVTSPWGWNSPETFFDGKRFVYTTTTDGIQAEVKVGDSVKLGMIAYNSYDGSKVLTIGLFAMRLVCSNGMLHNDYFPMQSFRHLKGNIDWDNQLEYTYKQLLANNTEENLNGFAGKLSNAYNTPVDICTLRELRNSIKDIPTGLFGEIMDHYLVNEEATKYGFINACSDILWHKDNRNIQHYKYNNYIHQRLIG